MLYSKKENGYSYHMNEKDLEKIHVIPIAHTVTNQELEDIMVTAFEGGINYWAILDNSTEIWDKQPEDMPNSQYALEILLNNGSIKFEDLEDEDDDSNWTLTLEKLLHGIALNHINRPFDCNLDNMDGTTADCIIQYALFDEIVYG